MLSRGDDMRYKSALQINCLVCRKATHTMHASTDHAPDDMELQALAEDVGERLRAAGQMLVTAESCTGGWIA